jgi:hypothetical protein
VARGDVIIARWADGIEDDHVLTADGAVNLALLTPKTVEDIESAMAAP